MPKFEAEMVMTPRATVLQVAIEPAVNALNSLVLLSQVDKFS